MVKTVNIKHLGLFFNTNIKSNNLKNNRVFGGNIVFIMTMC